MSSTYVAPAVLVLRETVYVTENASNASNITNRMANGPTVQDSFSSVFTTLRFTLPQISLSFSYLGCVEFG